MDNNMFVLHMIINHMLNQGKHLFCVFIDFSKAFDYVVTDNLWVKLIKLGIKGNICNIIKCMYETVKSRVKLSNKLSDSFDGMLGARQGESLSPFLLCMFVNDIEYIFIQKGFSCIDVTKTRSN